MDRQRTMGKIRKFNYGPAAMVPKVQETKVVGCCLRYLKYLIWSRKDIPLHILKLPAKCIYINVRNDYERNEEFCCKGIRYFERFQKYLKSEEERGGEEGVFSEFFENVYSVNISRSPELIGFVNV